MNKKAIFFACSKSHSNSSFKRACGLTLLISKSLNCNCEIIDFGYSFINKNRLLEKMPSTLKTINIKLFCLKRVRAYLKKNKPKYIFTVFLGIRAMKWLKKYCHKNKIVLVCDFCEWVQKSQFRLKGLAYGYMKNNYAVTKWVDHNTNVIAISSYLNNHFEKNRGANSIRIPNLIKFSDYKYIKPSPTNKKTAFIFIGNPIRKDFSDSIINAIYSLEKSIRDKIFVYMIGIDLRKKNNSKINKEKMSFLQKESTISVFKRIPYSKVLDIYKEVSFSMFFYESNEQNSKALFPTKLLDAFKNSRPILCNLASDIGMYAKNYYNSLIVDNSSEISIAEGIKCALSLSQSQIEYIAKNAFETANEFDVEKYVDSFQVFLKNCRI